jgi:hypothetical protein
MTVYPVSSSFINEIRYEETTGDLTVVMGGGREYTHPNVPQDVVDTFVNSPSKGSYYNQVIRTEY